MQPGVFGSRQQGSKSGQHGSPGVLQQVSKGAQVVVVHSGSREPQHGSVFMQSP